MKSNNMFFLLATFPFLSVSMEPTDYYTFMDSLPPLVDTEIASYKPAISSAPSYSSFDEESVSRSSCHDERTTDESAGTPLPEPLPDLPLYLSATTDLKIYTCTYPTCAKQFKKESSCHSHSQTHLKKIQKVYSGTPKRRKGKYTDETSPRKALLSLSCPFTACSFKADSQQMFDHHCTVHKDAIAKRFIGLLDKTGTADC